MLHYSNSMSDQSKGHVCETHFSILCVRLTYLLPYCVTSCQKKVQKVQKLAWLPPASIDLIFVAAFPFACFFTMFHQKSAKLVTLWWLAKTAKDGDMLSFWPTMIDLLAFFTASGYEQYCVNVSLLQWWLKTRARPTAEHWLSIWEWGQRIKLLCTPPSVTPGYPIYKGQVSC